MNLCGEEIFSCSTERLWATLTDAELVSRSIPDLDQVEQINENSFVCRVRPKLGFLAGTLRLAFDVVEKNQAQGRLRIRIDGKKIGARVEVEADLAVLSLDHGSQLNWTGRITKREGLLKPIGESLIQAAAARVIDAFWSKFRSALPAPPRKPD